MKQLFKSVFAPVVTGDVNPLWMASLRCGIALISLLHFFALQPDFDNIFSSAGFVPPDIANVSRNYMLPTIYGIYKFINGFCHVNYDTVLTVFRIAFPVSLLMLLAGLGTRAAAITSLLLQQLIVNSMEYYSYGVDIFTGIALFYCCAFPVGRVFSLDSYIFKKAQDDEWSARYLKLFQAHVCLIYFFSGFEKLLGANWRNGESIKRMVHGYNATEAVNVDFLYNTPIFLIVGWLTIIAELLYPVFINIPRIRKYWMAAIILFHTSIAFFMGLYFFSSVMIVLNVTAYWMPFVKRERRTVMRVVEMEKEALLI